MLAELKFFQILLVEDDEDHAHLTKRALHQSDLPNQVVHVEDGEQALTYLRKAATDDEIPMPDLILLDLKLPKINGHEVLTSLKNDPRLWHIPVVILTTSGSDIDRNQAYQHHVNSYVLKPLDAEGFQRLMAALGDYWIETNAPSPQPYEDAG